MLQTLLPCRHRGKHLEPQQRAVQSDAKRGTADMAVTAWHVSR